MKEIDIRILPELKEKCPVMALGTIHCSVQTQKE